MPHHRARHAFPLYDELCRFSPLVGVFGHRQVGKTTFVSKTVQNYVTFDDEDTLLQSEKSAKGFLEAHASARTGIDECQYSPKIFPALKEWVRTRKRPGQFVLTGSVRFSSRKAIRESLTGRLVSLELYPFVISEFLQTELPETIPKLLAIKVFDNSIERILRKPTSSQVQAFEKYFQNGGLPGLSFMRNHRSQQDGMASLLNLILDRDLRLVTQTSLPLGTLLRFLRFIAKTAWEPYRYSEARRQLGLSEVTQKKLIYGFESIFLLRRIPFSVTKGETYLLEDQLEEFFLSDGKVNEEAALSGVIYRNLRAQLGYQSGMAFQVDSFRTRSGARVPLVFSLKSKLLGIVPLLNEGPDLSQRRSVDSFLRHYPEAKVIYASSKAIEPHLLESRVLKVSAVSLMV